MLAGDTGGLVFNIQRFSLHDGPGIRTLVFLKGCPLRCIWCCNPEGQLGRQEIIYDRKSCIGCGACLKACAAGAITFNRESGFFINRAYCNTCSACVRVCPAGAKSLCGQRKTVDEIISVVTRDAAFFRHSGGGVTLGGGEVLFQPGFALELLKRCRRLGLNTAVETSGHGGWKWLKEIATHCHTVFFDLKALDPGRHLSLTGAGNELILSNLQALDQLAGPGGPEGPRLVIRLTVVPELNLDPESLKSICAFIKSRLKNVAGVELLPFHNLGEHKYDQLGRPYLLKGHPNVREDQVRPLKDIVEQAGLAL